MGCEESRQMAVALSDVLGKLNQNYRGKAESMIQYFNNKGALTASQLNFAKIILDMAKPKDPVPQAQVANFYKIVEVFDYAASKKNKKRKLRFGDNNVKVTISLAPETGLNAGMLYVKKNDEYQGKITRNGELLGIGAKDDKLLKMLSDFTMNPSKIAKDYGFATNECCCCGRLLTDPASIAAGIGPQCAEGWGF